MTRPIDYSGGLDGEGSSRKRPDPLGRGSAVGYTGAYHEAGALDLRDVVALQNARGPE
jgi:hypothetical protein